MYYYTYTQTQRDTSPFTEQKIEKNAKNLKGRS